jgi:hypothetical protein
MGLIYNSSEMPSGQTKLHFDLEEGWMAQIRPLVQREPTNKSPNFRSRSMCFIKAYSVHFLLMLLQFLKKKTNDHTWSSRSWFSQDYLQQSGDLCPLISPPEMITTVDRGPLWGTVACLRLFPSGPSSRRMCPARHFAMSSKLRI